jgi:hypothetical protein
LRVLFGSTPLLVAPSGTASLRWFGNTSNARLRHTRKDLRRGVTLSPHPSIPAGHTRSDGKTVVLLMGRIISQAASADLGVDAVYEGGQTRDAASDAVSKVMPGNGNQGGFRVVVPGGAEAVQDNRQRYTTRGVERGHHVRPGHPAGLPGSSPQSRHRLLGDVREFDGGGAGEPAAESLAKPAPIGWAPPVRPGPHPGQPAPTPG